MLNWLIFFITKPDNFWPRFTSTLPITTLCDPCTIFISIVYIILPIIFALNFSCFSLSCMMVKPPNILYSLVWNTPFYSSRCRGGNYQRGSRLNIPILNWRRSWGPSPNIFISFIFLWFLLMFNKFWNSSLFVILKYRWWAFIQGIS